jgi:hypothetical protein
VYQICEKIKSWTIATLQTYYINVVAPEITSDDTIDPSENGTTGK